MRLILKILLQKNLINKKYNKLKFLETVNQRKIKY